MGRIPSGKNKRVDLHCHSNASTEADEAVLDALQCPECYSEPMQVYRQALERGMDLVTLTDHDSVAGVEKLVEEVGGERVIVGEELTCYFPEDDCKMHVLVWGLSRQDHQDLQNHAKDIYRCAEIIEQRRLAHAVAHPVYRQNDKLERWHLERLLLMFKGFECLNGAHSLLHRQAFEPMLDELTPGKIREYERRHGMSARWPEPHVKARTGGSDDHGLFNIGRTWTEFAPEVETVEDVLEALRVGRCRPGGEAGSSVKLAHNFLAVGIRYWTRTAAPRATPPLPTQVLQVLVGDRKRVRRRDVARLVAGNAWRKSLGLIKRAVFRRSEPEPTGMQLLMRLFVESMGRRTGESEPLVRAYREGRAPLGEHEAMWDLVGEVNRDVLTGIRDAVERNVRAGQMDGLFDTISALAGQQFLMLPYYFAMFHQNRERADLHRITGAGRVPDRQGLRVCVFTDTLDEANGVSRFVRDMAEQAHAKGLRHVVATQGDAPDLVAGWRKNFRPMVSQPLGSRAGAWALSVPPVGEIMEWADREQFDVIHVDTAGPMGLMGLLVGAMLKVPVVGTYHLDLPRLVHESTGDYRLTAAAGAFGKWFYGRLHAVMAQGRVLESALDELEVDGRRRVYQHPVLDTGLFNPGRADDGVFARLGVKEPRRLLYVGRVSEEKNLPLLAEAFRRLACVRDDTALIVAGEGPYLEEMRKHLRGRPVYFIGTPGDEELAALYAGSDAFVFPSRMEAIGQVVLEAQACGCPAVVSDEGGSRDLVSDGLTGRVLAATDPGVWTTALDALLDDREKLGRYARAAGTRMGRYSLEWGFEQFWGTLLEAAVEGIGAASGSSAPVRSKARTTAAEVARQVGA
jgi:glycosyltransferase involved in cell wall biosynthesis